VLEAIEIKPSGKGCRLRRHHADLELLGQAWELAVAGLPPVPQK